MKNIKILSILIMVNIFLVGCNQNIVASTEPSETTSIKVNELKIITSQNGLYASQYAFTQNGFYEILEHSTGEGNILYTDFASNERMYLSTDLGLAENDHNNTSYVDSISEGSCIAITGENLFIIKRGSPQSSAKDEKKRTIIERRNLTGGGLKKTYIEANVTLAESSAVAYDGTALFFAAIEHSFDNNKVVNGRAIILRLNVKMMEIEVIHEFAEGDFVDIKGVSGDNLVLRKNYFDKKKQKGFSQILMLNISTQEIKEKVSLTAANQFKIYKDRIYLFDINDFILQEINLLNDEKRTINNIFNKKDFSNVSIVADIFDNNLFFSSYKEENGITQKWSVDLTNFIVKENTLYINDSFVGILGETETDFLVIAGEKVVKYTDTAPDKVTKFEAERFVQNIKKISKENYWNNNGKYIDITDNIKYR